jgi:hypothetical protein
VLNSGDNRFLLTNTGDVPITFGLSVDPNSYTLWKPAQRTNQISENIFMLCAVFSDPHLGQSQQQWFNGSGNDDIVSVMPKFAGGENFGFGKTSDGESVRPADTVALWFNFKAPESSGGKGADNLQVIRVKIFAVSD